MSRGTIAEVVAGLAAVGEVALVEALLQDRYAKSAASIRTSLITTWQYFHEQAFGHETPPVPMLPITVRFLVMVGALLKAGG